MTLKKLTEAAVLLAEDLAQDIALASTREEHIRVSARANAASSLAAELLSISSDGEDVEFVQEKEPGLF